MIVYKEFTAREKKRRKDWASGQEKEKTGKNKRMKVGTMQKLIVLKYNDSLRRIYSEEEEKKRRLS